MSQRTLPATATQPSPRLTVGRQVLLVGIAGTLLPLLALATLYLLAPWPLTEASIETLRTANRFAGALVLAHWGFTVLFALSRGVLRGPRAAARAAERVIPISRAATA